MNINLTLSQKIALYSQLRSDFYSMTKENLVNQVVLECSGDLEAKVLLTKGIKCMAYSEANVKTLEVCNKEAIKLLEKIGI